MLDTLSEKTVDTFAASAMPLVKRQSLPLDSEKPVAVHVNYLVNLASTTPLFLNKSIEAFRGEIERAAHRHKTDTARCNRL